MKLGYIDYLNCFPFYYHLFERQALDGVEVFPARPNILNAMIRDNSLEMSPISAATCAELAEKVVLLPDFCLSSVGYVGSVLLVSKVPIEALQNRKVALTNASHTSVVLLKVLLKKYYQVEPDYISSDLIPDIDQFDAALLIGNEAMKYKPGYETRVYDLGELWLKHSGFPVVFAAFAIQESVAEKQAAMLQAITLSFYRSLACLQTDRSGMISSAMQKYPDIHFDLNAYYDYLKFYFTDNLKQALQFYCQTASDLGLLNMPCLPRFMTSF